jgi:hypothetical protein
MAILVAAAPSSPNLLQAENDDCCHEDKEEQKETEWSEESNLNTYIKYINRSGVITIFVLFLLTAEAGRKPSCEIKNNISEPPRR